MHAAISSGDSSKKSAQWRRGMIKLCPGLTGKLSRVQYASPFRPVTKRGVQKRQGSLGSLTARRGPRHRTRAPLAAEPAAWSMARVR